MFTMKMCIMMYWLRVYKREKCFYSKVFRWFWNLEKLENKNKKRDKPFLDLLPIIRFWEWDWHFQWLNGILGHLRFETYKEDRWMYFCDKKNIKYIFPILSIGLGSWNNMYALFIDFHIICFKAHISFHLNCCNNEC